jgi:hypothetical protein
MKGNGFDFPILLIGYTRPSLTAKQVEVLRAIKPTKIYFYLDGPKSSKEAELMRRTEMELDKIDWDVSIIKNINTNSQGAAKSITSSITWAFEREKNLIILEDDVIPCKEFFSFCEYYLHQDLLESNIAMISGHQIKLNDFNGTLASQLSLYPRIWGWATQKDIWEKFDYKRKYRILEKIFYTLKISNYNLLFFLYLCYINLRIRLKLLDTWDYQFLYFTSSRRYFCLVPTANLVKNLGFGPGATNTKLDKIYQEYLGSGLQTNLIDIKKLEYSKSGDVEWRKYRLRMVFDSARHKFKRKLYYG